jgi:hypothetical protein
MKIALLLSALFLIVGCGGPQNANGGYEANMTGITVQPMTMMVATPIPQTLYIVMDPAKVADDITIQNSKNTMIHFRQFFSDGLKKSLAPYFQNVEIVAPGFAAPTEPHVIADVKLDSIEARDFYAGGLTYVTLLMQWSFAIRPNQETDYLFSYSGVGSSDQTYATLQEGAQQMLKSSLAGLLQGWTDKKAYQTLKEYDANKTVAPIEEPVSKEL